MHIVGLLIYTLPYSHHYSQLHMKVSNSSLNLYHIIKKEKSQDLSEETVDTQYIDLTNKSPVIPGDTNTSSTSASLEPSRVINSKCVRHFID